MALVVCSEPSQVNRAHKPECQLPAQPKAFTPLWMRQKIEQILSLNGSQLLSSPFSLAVDACLPKGTIMFTTVSHSPCSWGQSNSSNYHLSSSPLLSHEDDLLHESFQILHYGKCRTPVQLPQQNMLRSHCLFLRPHTTCLSLPTLST